MLKTQKFFFYSLVLGADIYLLAFIEIHILESEKDNRNVMNIIVRQKHKYRRKNLFLKNSVSISMKTKSNITFREFLFLSVRIWCPRFEKNRM